MINLSSYCIGFTKLQNHSLRRSRLTADGEEMTKKLLSLFYNVCENFVVKNQGDNI